MQLAALKKADVHKIDQRSAILQLLPCLIHICIKLFQSLIPKSLLDGVAEGFKCEGERRAHFFQLIDVHRTRQSLFQHESDEVIPGLLRVDDTLRVICRDYEHFFKFLLVVNIDLAQAGILLNAITYNMRCLIDFYHLFLFNFELEGVIFYLKLLISN